jgi:hypothetical protein
MKRYFPIFMLLLVANAQAQFWPNFEYRGQWVRVKEVPSNEPDTYNWEVSGGVSYQELFGLGLSDMGDHNNNNYGYYQFNGEAELEPQTHILSFVINWPPGILENVPPTYIPERTKFITSMSMQSGFCNCDCPGGEIDTIFPVDGFGFCLEDSFAPPNLWGINAGYVVYAHHSLIWRKPPCPPSPMFWKGEDPIYFADSNYAAIPNGTILSGYAPLYLKATTTPNPQSLHVLVYNTISPQDSIGKEMILDSTLDIWTAKIDSDDVAKLKVKSYGNITAKTSYYGYSDTSRAFVDLVKPKVFMMVDSTETDTVFINSETMKVAKDVTVGLSLTRDAGNVPVNAKNVIDTVGYKYKSRWISAAICSDTSVHPDTMFREYPLSPQSYFNWNHSADSCKIIFNRDSLYAVGGKLTIECRGKVKRDSTWALNTKFKIVTDSILANPIDSLKKKLILINGDPANTLFSDSLKKDRIRAIAWNEGAGTLPEVGHPHSRFPWNHYWFDTFTPCENGGSSATGIMQIVRKWWQAKLDSLPYVPDTGYVSAKWDSMAWNWQICIKYGIFIHDVYYPNRYYKEQKMFPDSCSFDSCGLFTKYKNKEDLNTYAYHTNLAKMHNILDDIDWQTYISDSLTISADNIYVRKVRQYTYTKPWE